MERKELERLAFLATWYQNEAELLRHFTICIYLKDNGVEVIDNKTRKVFLRRRIVADLTARDFFVGSKIFIYGRQYSLVGYANESTRNYVSKYTKKTLFLLNYMVIPRLGEILVGLIDSGITISNAVMVKLNKTVVKTFSGHNTDANTISANFLSELLKGPSIALEITAENVIGKISKCFLRGGECAQSLQLLLNTVQVRPNIYTSPNEMTAKKDLNLFFSPLSNLEITCDFNASTVAVIKPHCIKEGNLGKIIKEIMDKGFVITGLRMFMLEKSNSEEFYEVYCGVVSEYMQMVTQLSSGICLALAVRCEGDGNTCHREFRQFCGPHSAEMAKHLRPNTLRAKFGTNRVLNAIHCTDLPGDRDSELEYLFKVLD